MATRNAKGQFVKRARSRGVKVIRPRARSPVVATPTVVQVTAPAAPKRRRRAATTRKATPVAAKKRKAPARRRASPRKSGSGLLQFGAAHSRMAMVMAAALLGYAQKQGWLAKLPHVGSAGPITSFALLGWGLEELGHMKFPPLLHDAVTNALTISAFNIGVGGAATIVGDERQLTEGAAYSMPGGAVFFD